MNRPTHRTKIYRETENFALLSRDLATRSLKWGSRPTAIEFSFNNACNLQCIMCGRTADYPSRSLPLDIGLEALDEILPSALTWTPSSYSEPFTEDLDLISRLCGRYEVALSFFTNGLLCTEERFRKIRQWVHRLWFSFDSHHKETYEKIRVGSSFEKVVKNIRSTMTLAEEYTNEIGFQMVLMHMNLKSLPDYVRFIASLGGKLVYVQELIPYSNNYDQLKVDRVYSEEEIVEVIEDAKAAAREESMDLVLKLSPPLAEAACYRKTPARVGWPLQMLREFEMESINKIYPSFCNMAANYLKVTPEGDLFPCCRGPASLKMGNIKEASFEAIWNGEPYQAFRKGMFEGEYDPACRTCYIFRDYKRDSAV
ncbi:MAG: radical SAM protein [Planctomycetes bacterium]|nr:radical SAM protein [Planctomycetota bacterium]